jgi:hypothetical protein
MHQLLALAPYDFYGVREGRLLPDFLWLAAVTLELSGLFQRENARPTVFDALIKNGTCGLAVSAKCL